jgi:hypothetical protein
MFLNREIPTRLDRIVSRRPVDRPTVNFIRFVGRISTDMEEHTMTQKCGVVVCITVSKRRFDDFLQTSGEINSI